ncbi:protein THYLAKOID ASSEMBLY 8, chloroplastic [Henckelia pumila]|uniref:protein THYLAKOID ASSEMBLY 8, chloroplastic n=1 Tax=Henckelia pumila TaxID=405737 RepID=UPI003C6E60A4
MAYTLHCKPTLFPTPATASPAVSHRLPAIRCGPRDNRGPLLKGRILSTEAIQAIQSLKRSHRANPASPSLPTHILSRLIKSDLVAAFNELLRQEHCTLALGVFSTIRSEYRADLNMYADLVSALAKKGLREEIDGLIGELEMDGGISFDDEKGLLKLVKAVIEAERRESTVRIYGLMKRSGSDSGSVDMDDHLGKVLRNGFRRFGEDALADEVEWKFGRFYKEILGKP